MPEAIHCVAQSDVPRLQIVDASDDPAAWDDLVSRSEGASFCHLAGWRDIFADGLGHECLQRAAVMDGVWQGILPLVRMKSRLFGHRLISVPFLNSGGPLGSPAAQQRLGEWAVQEATRSGADVLELRSRKRGVLPHGFTPAREKVRVLLDLPGDPGALWTEPFSSKLRSQIRRPQKEGMEALFGAEHLDAFYEVYSRNMRDLGTPVLSRKLFERIRRVFGDAVVIGAVYHRDRPTAAGFGFVFGGEFEMTWASSLREFNRMAPNMLLYWSFMERMIARGVQVFDFGRSTPGGSTHRFKRQWGGEDVDLQWVEWSNPGRAVAGSSDGRLRDVGAAAWRRLPLGVANRIGPVLARRLPWW